MVRSCVPRVGDKATSARGKAKALAAPPSQVPAPACARTLPPRAAARGARALDLTPPHPHLTSPPEPQEGDKATSARGKAKALAAPPPAGLRGKVREAGKSSLADDDDFQQRPASQPTRSSRARPEVQRYKASSQGGGQCKGQI